MVGAGFVAWGDDAVVRQREFDGDSFGVGTALLGIVGALRALPVASTGRAFVSVGSPAAGHLTKMKLGSRFRRRRRLAVFGMVGCVAAWDSCFPQV